MDKKILTAVLAVMCLASCGKAQNSDTPVTTAETTVTTAAETTAAQAEDVKETSETTSVETTVEVKTEAETTSAAEETTEAVTEEAAAEAPSSEKTNGKPVVTKDMSIVEGIDMGMTVDEVKSVLGDPEVDESYDTIHMLTYGEDVFMFEEMNSTYDDGEKRLMFVILSDDEMKIGNGPHIGATKEEVLDSFCRDLEDNTPEGLKEDNGKLIYGRDAFDILDKFENDEINDRDKAEGEYRLAYEFADEEDKGIAYVDFGVHEKLSFYMVMYALDENDVVSGITIMYSDSEEFDDLLG